MPCSSEFTPLSLLSQIAKAWNIKGFKGLRIRKPEAELLENFRPEGELLENSRPEGELLENSRPEAELLENSWPEAELFKNSRPEAELSEYLDILLYEQVTNLNVWD